jgi:cysteinyl-tRNA synthetase
VSLRIYNTLTRQKEPFTPLVPGAVGMYVCGVTPYDVSHVGHARSAVVFDLIRRYLVFRGYRVTFVKNYTDIEDKIIARAARSGEDWRGLADRNIRAYEEDMAWLGVEPPDEAPRATDHITPDPQDPYRMITLIERLVATGVAYVVDGDVYFEVRQFPAYGRLSGRDLSELRSGARVEVDERKRDPLDFALWKASKPGEPSWPSPWGAGRPGWHIECSAMSMKYLGETFDIHGGGQDLVFPHHENEIAQSEGATGQSFARYWVHNGFVNVGSEKMSKSLGNMLNIRQLREGTPSHPGGFDAEGLRRYFLESHYRGPLDLSELRILEGQRPLSHARQLVGRALQAAGAAGLPGEDLQWDQLRAILVDELVGALRGGQLGDDVGDCWIRFQEAMDDDFNSARALGALSDLVGALNRYYDAGLRGARLDQFRHGAGMLLVLGRVLGLLWRQVNPYEFTPQHRKPFEGRLAEREAARERRDWARADQIRDELAAEGVLIEDRPGEPPRLRWKRVPTEP